MEKKIAGLIGAVAALSTFGTAQASPAPAQDPTAILKAASFAELLEPIPNAATLLQAVDESAATSEDNVQLAQLYVQGRGHHHHHAQSRRYVPRVVVVAPRRFRHHHHHHSHYYRRDRH